MTLTAASGLATLIPILLVVACPLMMILMMRGHGHGTHGHQGRETLEELERRRDQLNEEIAERAEQRVHGGSRGAER